MQNAVIQDETFKPWPLWQRLLFRFFFIYWALFLLTYPVFSEKPVIKYIGYAQMYVVTVITNGFNNYFLHYGQQSGLQYTPYRLAQLLLHVILAVVGMVIWSIAARRQKSCSRANYWLITAMRYFLAYICFLYGVIKIFALQMPFATLTDMATPMGNIAPINLLWDTMGYSTPYQVILGIAEVAAGILLLYRRTITLGAFISLGVYTNVFLLNIAYDIPVKIVSAHLVIMCLYLLLADAKRLAAFFIFDKAVLPNAVYIFRPKNKQWARVRLALKVLFLLNTAYIIQGYYKLYIKNNALTKTEVTPIPYGLYAVTTFVKNGDTLTIAANDSLAWKDFIFERSVSGKSHATVNSTDTVFSRRYARGSFYYDADTLKNILECYKNTAKGRRGLFTMHYKILGNGRVELWTKVRQDSLYFELEKSRHTFTLQKKPFSWLNERIKK